MEIRLGDYVKIKTGKLNANAQDENGKYPFFTCAKSISRINTFAYDCECVLVAGNGVLNAKYYNGKFNAYQRVYIIEVKDNEELSTRFLYYFIDKYMERLRDGSIGGIIQYIKLNHLTDITLNLPDLPTQNKIVALLDKASALVQKREKSISQLDELLRAQFLDLFGDPVLNPRGWEILNFKDVAKNENSKRVPIKKGDRAVRQGIFPYYGATGIIDSFDDYKFDGNFLLIAEDGKNLLFRKKDNAFLATGKFWVNNHAHVLSSNGVTSLIYLMKSFNFLDLKAHITGIDQIKLNKTNLEKIPIPVPPIKLQTEFEAIYHNIQAQKETLNQSKTELENLYNSLLQRAFNGQLNFNVDAELDVLLATIVLEKEENDIRDIATVYARRLLERLQTQEFENQDQYQQAKQVAFQMLKEGTIVQEYDAEEKAVKMKLV